MTAIAAAKRGFAAAVKTTTGSWRASCPTCRWVGPGLHPYKGEASKDAAAHNRERHSP